MTQCEFLSRRQADERSQDEYLVRDRITADAESGDKPPFTGQIPVKKIRQEGDDCRDSGDPQHDRVFRYDAYGKQQGQRDPTGGKSVRMQGWSACAASGLTLRYSLAADVKLQGSFGHLRGSEIPSDSIDTDRDSLRCADP